MIDITDKTLCSGCGACKAVCPKKCIEIIHDEEGFRYPKIDDKRCIKCNLCSKICPIINFKENECKSLGVYGAINNDTKILKTSSSGGVFAAIAKNIIKKNGVVFGVTYDNENGVHHIYIDNMQDLKKILGSKYVESDVKVSFEKAEEFLKEGRLVLFSGTPCQIAGLRSYLRKDYDNLLTCDFICTGVPSLRIFNAYKNYYSKKYNSNVVNVEFRNKKDGWIHFNMVFHFENGKKKYILRYMNPYILLLYNFLSIRPSCYHCRFRKLNSGSDIKLADFWKIQEAKNKIFDFNGVSHVMINSLKAEKVFAEIKSEFRISESTFDEVLKLNKSFTSYSYDLKKREQLMNNIANLSDDEIVKRIKKLFPQKIITKIKIFIRIQMSKIKYRNKK